MSTRPSEGVYRLVREPEARPAHRKPSDSQGLHKDLTGPRDTLAPTGLIPAGAQLSLGPSAGKVQRTDTVSFPV